MRRFTIGRRRTGHAGFNLVQLMVVIGLILVAVAFLIPTVHNTRRGENSSRVRCAANLKQIGNGLILYSNENKGSFPRTHAVDGAPVQLTNDGFADADPFKVEPAGRKINNIPQAMFLLIRQEDLTPSVFICPSGTAEADDMGGQLATSRSNFTGTGVDGGDVVKNLSYSFVNVYPTSTAQKHGYKTFITAFSSDFATAADISPLPIDSPVWNEIKVGSPRSSIIKGNSKHHDSDGQNVLYADGHAEFQQTPLCGANNDNIYTVQSSHDADINNAEHPTPTTDGTSALDGNPDPRSANDSVLLIHTP